MAGDSDRISDHWPSTASIADGSPGYFFHCCKNLEDALTVEDAIFWHCEIINEFALELHAVDAVSGNAMNDVIAVLEERQRYHGRCVNRLTGVVRDKAQLIWSPRALSKD